MKVNHLRPSNNVNFSYPLNFKTASQPPQVYYTLPTLTLFSRHERNFGGGRVANSLMVRQDHAYISSMRQYLHNAINDPYFIICNYIIIYKLLVNYCLFLGTYYVCVSLVKLKDLVQTEGKLALTRKSNKTN